MHLLTNTKNRKKKTTGKRFSCLLALIIVMSTTLCGCGSTKTSSDSEGNGYIEREIYEDAWCSIEYPAGFAVDVTTSADPEVFSITVYDPADKDCCMYFSKKIVFVPNETKDTYVTEDLFLPLKQDFYTKEYIGLTEDGGDILAGGYTSLTGTKASGCFAAGKIEVNDDGTVTYHDVYYLTATDERLYVWLEVMGQTLQTLQLKKHDTPKLDYMQDLILVNWSDISRVDE